MPISQLNLTINNLNYNTEYSFYITSYNLIYQSINSNICTATTNTLNIPTLNINIYNITPSPSVNLNLLYGNVGCTTNPYSYNLYGSTTSPINIPSNGQPTPYTLSLNYSTIYTLYIKYLANTNDESTQSNNITIDTNTYPPTDVVASTDAGRLTITWQLANSRFVTAYRVYIKKDSGLFNLRSTLEPNITTVTYNFPQGTYRAYVEAVYNTRSSSQAFSNDTIVS